MYFYNLTVLQKLWFNKKFLSRKETEKKKLFLKGPKSILSLPIVLYLQSE